MQRALDILRTTFGYDQFRPAQAAIIQQLAEGGDALVLMPTGGGKSLCYQIPALLRPGVGVVVSPLIALMQDQVTALRQNGVRAACLNSTLSPREAQEVEQALAAGELDLLYLAPERLLVERTLQLLMRAPLALFAIDEAHCVSQWGHDFRPEYVQLSVLPERFPQVPRIALTATADRRTRDEIVERLALQEAEQFVTGFDRPNIRYRIVEAHNARQQLLDFIRREHPGEAGIVYCLSRRKVEETAAWLVEQGIPALPYHAGMPGTQRAMHQERFLRDEGRVMVATVAFGMGIDKPDVRFVAHLNLPKSIEAYYQETGRGGRDGLPADAWMAYSLQDVLTLRKMINDSEGDIGHKRLEGHKLDAMLALCEVADCRRQHLLGYFTDAPHEPCGNCDNCLEPPERWDATTAAQKALSTVYRSGQRYGVSYLTDILLGKANERIVQQGHDRLSTFGIGDELNASQWRDLFRQLVALGYLQVDVEGYGGLRLTAQCRPLLKGETSLELRRPRSAKERRRERKEQTVKGGFSDPTEQALWQALRDARLRLARELEIPPYVIFHDATLMAMVQHRPATREEMAAISGVGATKLERYGETFLAVIAQWQGG